MNRSRGIGIVGRTMCAGGLLLLAGWATVFAATPPTARVSGQVRKADSDAPVARAQVRIEGPTLVSRENSQIIQKVKSDGRYQLDVPPGTYELWASAPDFEETKVRLELAAGGFVARDLELRPLQKSPYRVETLKLPQQMIGEVSGVAFTPKGSLVVTNRRGDVWIRGYADERWRRFASGIYEGFGVVATDEADTVRVPAATRVRTSRPSSAACM